MAAPAAVTAGTLAGRVEASLRALADGNRAVRERAYLKSDLLHLGVAVPEIRRVVRTTVREAGPSAHQEVVASALGLWERGIHECRMAAVELLAFHSDLLGPDDLGMVERLLRTARTWALVDPLAIDVAGDIVDRDPGAAARLDSWAHDPDPWMRRASLLALLRPLRRGAGDFDRFARYAHTMLDEREFFVRKAIGWVLRETGKRRPELVVAWLEPRVARASGVTFREAVKPLPESDRGRLLAARSAAR